MELLPDPKLINILNNLNSYCDLSSLASTCRTLNRQIEKITNNIIDSKEYDEYRTYLANTLELEMEIFPKYISYPLVFNLNSKKSYENELPFLKYTSLEKHFCGDWKFEVLSADYYKNNTKYSEIITKVGSASSTHYETQSLANTLSGNESSFWSSTPQDQNTNESLTYLFKSLCKVKNVFVRYYDRYVSRELEIAIELRDENGNITKCKSSPPFKIPSTLPFQYSYESAKLVICCSYIGSDHPPIGNTLKINLIGKVSEQYHQSKAKFYNCLSQVSASGLIVSK